jgi:PIN domain nuclease of toxin-antitoxin system
MLLDTHIWLWDLLDPDRLTAAGEGAVLPTDNEIWLSAISVGPLSALSLRDGNLCDLAPDHADARAAQAEEVHVPAGANGDVVVSLR